MTKETSWWRRQAARFGRALVGEAARDSLRELRGIMARQYCEERLHREAKYQDPRNLVRHGYQVYSQDGEDGILAEVFRRIGTGSKYFVELGAGNGLENNTTALLLAGWRGCWLESDPSRIAVARDKFHRELAAGELTLVAEPADPQTIEARLTAAGAPRDLDLLSIDIDGNDYWLWDAIRSASPRAVVVEYNAALGPELRWVMKYIPGYRWDGSTCVGASLKSLQLLGEQKGYRLVGCSLLGTNAFFVRHDLVADRFQAPYTAEYHFEPPRYELYRKPGPWRNHGAYERR